MILLVIFCSLLFGFLAFFFVQQRRNCFSFAQKNANVKLSIQSQKINTLCKEFNICSSPCAHKEIVLSTSYDIQKAFYKYYGESSDPSFGYTQDGGNVVFYFSRSATEPQEVIDAYAADALLWVLYRESNTSVDLQQMKKTIFEKRREMIQEKNSPVIVRGVQ